MLRRNGLVVKSVESVLRLEGSLWLGKICERGIGLEETDYIRTGSQLSPKKQCEHSSIIVTFFLTKNFN